VAFSEELAPGAVLTRHYFGQDFVLYRTSDGVAHASDAYCPHLGAHFGFGGSVVDNRLRCPFHGWCFEPSGRCVEVPGALKIPPRAHLPAWATRELNGVLFVYYHADGQLPTWEPPTLNEDEWTRNRTVLWSNLRTHPQEVFENSVDSAHLKPVHDASAHVHRTASDDGETFSVALGLHASGAVIGMPEMMNDVILDVTLYGLGLMYVHTHVITADLYARQRIYATPIDGEKLDLRGVVNVKKGDNDDATSDALGEIFYQAYITDFVKDFPIWENKRYRDQPLLTTADGPFVPYRRWARQFYSRNAPPVAAAAE
jgi:phenylpropionate dioxygenase-like ring-hydroxylating dioxygenase large terminal subunit